MRAVIIVFVLCSAFSTGYCQRLDLAEKSSSEAMESLKPLGTPAIDYFGGGYRDAKGDPIVKQLEYHDKLFGFPCRLQLAYDRLYGFQKLAYDFDTTGVAVYTIIRDSLEHSYGKPARATTGDRSCSWDFHSYWLTLSLVNTKDNVKLIYGEAGKE